MKKLSEMLHKYGAPAFRLETHLNRVAEHQGLDSVVSGQQFVTIDQVGVQSFLLFMSLVAGLVFANAIVEPRKAL